MLRQAELVHRAHFRVDDAEDEIDAETLTHNARAIAAKLIRVSKIGIAAFVELRSVQFRKKTFGKRERLFRIETRRIRPNRLQRSVQSPERRRVYAKMNIGRARTLSDGQVFIDMR